MKPVPYPIFTTAMAFAFFFSAGLMTLAQDGKLRVHVTPQQAYIFVDGHAVGEASKHPSITVSPGDHKLDLANYGYALDSRTVTISPGQTTSVDAALTPVSSTVSGPFGAITIEGANHDAILLNGKTPPFFVGHGDEFNHDWWWKQELVVPPGSYQVTVLEGDHEKWSGQVDVPADQRVVLDIPNGVRKTVDWPRGATLNSIPRFAAGSASATVAVAKPTAQLSASNPQINCGDSSQLQWTTADAGTVSINPVGAVPASGQQSVQPLQTTAYQLMAVGPGGTVSSDTTVNVNTGVQAKLDLSPAEVHYRRMGDKVTENSGTTLNWASENASNVTIDGLGTVTASGSSPLQATPKKTDPGPVSEDVTYTLNATNACGGSDTKTVTLHIVGQIENAETVLAMRSVYFPTDVPATTQDDNGLLASEQSTLQAIATVFKDYLANHAGASLILTGHADERGPEAYNQSLSDRRAELAKKYLLEQGVPEGSIQTQAVGKDKNLSSDEVKQLVEQNPQVSDEDREKALERLHTIVLAHNRRVDISLSTTGQESKEQYPFSTPDYATLVDRNGPARATACCTLP